MDEIQRMPHDVWLDSPQLPGLTGDKITQHLAGILLEPYEAAGLGGVEPIELEKTLRGPRTRRSAWLPPAAVLELLEVLVQPGSPRLSTAEANNAYVSHAATPTAPEFGISDAVGGTPQLPQPERRVSAGGEGTEGAWAPVEAS
eukprot:jgi/Tetstr1/427131/TSEL_001718.t1